jgi:hypothetical protein
MNFLERGQYFGQTNKTIRLQGITLTDTEYTQDKVDWHYHQNAYFTFILYGKLLETNKKETYHCAAGTLLFHHWQEPHYNIKPNGNTRGFHLEIEQDWFENHYDNIKGLEGSINISNPDTKLLLLKLIKETGHTTIFPQCPSRNYW